MATDIDRIKEQVRRLHPQVVVEQVVVTHPADDDGLWFFRAGGVEVQLESATGNLPFLVESDAHPRRSWVHTVEEAVSTIEGELRLR